MADNRFDNIPPWVDPDAQLVQVVISKHQARLVLSALNCRYKKLSELQGEAGGRGYEELKSQVQAAYKSIDHQVYGVRLGREGIQEAGQ